MKKGEQLQRFLKDVARLDVSPKEAVELMEEVFPDLFVYRNDEAKSE